MTTNTPASTTLPLTASGRVDGRSARKVETRRKVILAAADLFAESGYDGTSMDEIAEAAGVSKGTIFYNFKNKAELFEQLIMHAAEVIGDEVSRARDEHTGWDALTAAMGRIVAVIDENPSYAQIILNELFRASRPWAALLPDARRLLTDAMAAIIEELGDERTALLGARAVDHRDLHAVAMSTIGACVVATLDHKAFEPDVPLAEVHERLMLAIHGMNPALATAMAAAKINPLA